jgi:DNA-binding response OmpR family regulator
VHEIARTVQKGLAERQKRLRHQDPVVLLERALDSLKNSSQPSEPASPDRFLRAQGVALDVLKQLVVVRGEQVELTPTEFDILAFLMRHRDRVVSCQEIVAHVHGHELDERDARVVLRTHIHRLRQKIERDPSVPAIICTVRGSGYSFSGGA